MLDFVRISTHATKNGTIEVYPKFKVTKNSDLMIRGGDFYAIWDESNNVWSLDEMTAINLIDNETEKKANELRSECGDKVRALYLWDADSGMIDKWHKYCQRQARDNYHQLNEKLIFANQNPKKTDYSSKQLPYPLESGDHSAFDKILTTLYDPSEADKILWAIGSIVSGDSKDIQKFLVFYGSAGTGKSTILNIVQQLFPGYYAVFDAKSIGSANASFALEPFKENPLVAIQHDGDLSRIEDNTRLNSLISHEVMTVNEKFKSSYPMKFNAFLFMGTNKPVKITDSKSGIIRRLIDVTPSGRKLSHKEYVNLTKRISFELGPIAYYCQQVYLEDPYRYDGYRPEKMMIMSNDFYNFIQSKYFVYKRDDGVGLNSAWASYKNWCEESSIRFPLNLREFKTELMSYFDEYIPVAKIDGNTIVGYLHGFKTQMFLNPEKINIPSAENIESSNNNASGSESENNNDISSDIPDWLNLKDPGKDISENPFSVACADCVAQYANDQGTPYKKWDDVKTTLKDLDQTVLHYVRVPENHIVIDFDIRGKDGKTKDLAKNLLAASKWPKTYAECSKSGEGLHLHYIYNGDVMKLSCIYDDYVEVKVFTGKSSLRRKLSKSNDCAIATISSGLPLKEDTTVVSGKSVKSEKGLRAVIKRNLYKEIHPGTKPSIDFIYKILEDAYNSDLKYDVSDLRNAILIFAANSTHNAQYCVNVVSKMKFKSESRMEAISREEAPIAFYDIEIFPNLFLVNYKLKGSTNAIVRLINPTASDIEVMMQYRLVGFNNRRYDNHMIYGCFMGYSVPQLYQLSQDIIEHKTGFFGEAYNISYTDVYDFASKKQSLKKWEIELSKEANDPNSGMSDDVRDICKLIKHHELGLPWDEPVPKELWTKVAEYCDDDVLATEAVFMARQSDFVAREILADITGSSVNDTTNSLTTKLIFGNNRKPQLNYTDLATGEQTNPTPGQTEYLNAFPGYEYKWDQAQGKYINWYMDTDLGRGGYIRSNPGIYENVAMLDIASLHPHSIIAMNYFGEYTKRYEDLVNARIAVKHGDYDTAGELFDGAFKPYLTDKSSAKNLAQAMKIALNSCYGLTAASFDNPMRDIRNKNNIVALRGALFMRTLQAEVESRGFAISAIKTDSLKIVNATKDIIDFCMEFAKKYGYTFEHETTYSKLFQMNDADYVAKYASDEYCMKNYGYIPSDNAKAGENTWCETGARFAVPYVFKTLFTHEPYIFDDFCLTKEASKGIMYLDTNEGLTPQPEVDEEISRRELNARIEANGLKTKPKKLNPDFDGISLDALKDISAKSHSYHFIGKIGEFCPIKPGCGGGLLMCNRNGKYNNVTGTKGYRWLESETVRNLNKADDIDTSYFIGLVNEAKDAIMKYGDFEWFVS